MNHIRENIEVRWGRPDGMVLVWTEHHSEIEKSVQHVFRSPGVRTDSSGATDSRSIMLGFSSPWINLWFMLRLARKNRCPCEILKTRIIISWQECLNLSCQSHYVSESKRSSRMTLFDSIAQIVAAYNPLEGHIIFSNMRFLSQSLEVMQRNSFPFSSCISTWYPLAFMYLKLDRVLFPLGASRAYETSIHKGR